MIRENKCLYKKINLGISLYMKAEDYEYIFSKYREYIRSVFFSLPFYGKNKTPFTNRTDICEQLENKNNVLKLYKIIKIAEKYNIKKDAVINGMGLTDNDVIQSFGFLKRIKPDEITIMDEHKHLYKKEFKNIPLIYSFNNKRIYDFSDNIYSMYAFGKDFLWDESKRQKIYENSKMLMLLLDNGCNLYCPGCFLKGEKMCEFYYAKRRKEVPLEELLAEQLFLPEDVQKLCTNFDTSKIVYKLSTRRCVKKEMDLLLETYTHFWSLDEILNNKIEIALYSKLPYMYDDIKNANLNFDILKKTKEKLWEKSLQTKT